MARQSKAAKSASAIADRLMHRAPLRLVTDQTKIHSKSLSPGGTVRPMEAPVRHECWRCHDTGFNVGTCGARRCTCGRRKIVRNALLQIPPRFGNPKLSRLVPDPNRHPRQSLVISTLKLNPDRSYLLCGENGTGKTHFAWALYRHALAKGRRVIGCSVRELLEDYRKAVTSGGTETDATIFRPRVLPDDLKVRGIDWTILLDEFEKARPSEFAVEMLFALLDAAYQFQHQLILTSNFSVDKLIAHWGRLDEVWGKFIVRRLEVCTRIEMF
jgi:IstB-like ATP binding protein